MVINADAVSKLMRDGFVD